MLGVACTSMFFSIPHGSNDFIQLQGSERLQNEISYEKYLHERNETNCSGNFKLV